MDIECIESRWTRTLQAAAHGVRLHGNVQMRPSGGGRPRPGVS
jgi:hypothetical protein